MAEDDCELSDNEGTLLSLILRQQPITAYLLAKIYEASPVSNFNTSKGKIYPLIRRLKERGLLTGAAVVGDRRGTEHLASTVAGSAAVQAWTRQIRPEHLLLEDPLRTKVQSFDLLSREEQIEWVVDCKALLTRKLDEVERYGESVSVPYQDLVHANAVRALRARMAWLDQVLHAVVKSPGP